MTGPIQNSNPLYPAAGVPPTPGVQRTHTPPASPPDSPPVETAPESPAPPEYSGRTLAPDQTPDPEQGVTFGSPTPAPPNEVPPLKQIETILTDNYGDSLVLAQDESDAIHGILDNLPPRAYSATLRALDTKGLLDDYVGHLDSAERDRFISQATDKGYLKVQEGRPNSTQSSLEVPPGPDRIPNKSEYPMPIREMIQGFNLEKANAYVQEFDAYVERYATAVESATTGEELRALGAPALPHSVSPGIESDGISASQRDAWILEFPTNPSTFEDYTALSRKSRDILGLPQPGTMEFSLSAEGSIDVMGLQVGGKRELAVDTLGRTRDDREWTGGVTDAVFGDPSIPESSEGAGDGYSSPVSVGVGVKVNDQGETEVTGQGQLGTDDYNVGAEFETTDEGLKLKKASATVAGLGGSVEGTTLQTAVGAEESANVEVSYGVASAAWDGQTLENKVGGEIGADGAKLRVEGSVKAVFLTQSEIEAILTDRTTLFTVPPELETGTPWEQLTPERQAELTLKLWTPEEWGRKVGQ